jgi:hypothetical protein
MSVLMRPVRESRSEGCYGADKTLFLGFPQALHAKAYMVQIGPSAASRFVPVHRLWSSSYLTRRCKILD